MDVGQPAGVKAIAGTRRQKEASGEVEMRYRAISINLEPVLAKEAR